MEMLPDRRFDGGYAGWEARQTRTAL